MLLKLLPNIHIGVIIIERHSSFRQPRWSILTDFHSWNNMYLRTLVDFATDFIPAEFGHLVVILSGFIFHHFARLLLFFDALWLIEIVIVTF